MPLPVGHCADITGELNQGPSNHRHCIYPLEYHHSRLQSCLKMVSIFWSEQNFQCAAACFKTPSNRPQNQVLQHAAACFTHWCLVASSPGRTGQTSTLFGLVPEKQEAEEQEGGLLGVRSSDPWRGHPYSEVYSPRTCLRRNRTPVDGGSAFPRLRPHRLDMFQCIFCTYDTVLSAGYYWLCLFWWNYIVLTPTPTRTLFLPHTPPHFPLSPGSRRVAGVVGNVYQRQ